MPFGIIDFKSGMSLNTEFEYVNFQMRYWSREENFYLIFILFLTQANHTLYTHTHTLVGISGIQFKRKCHTPSKGKFEKQCFDSEWLSIKNTEEYILP